MRNSVVIETVPIDTLRLPLLTLLRHPKKQVEKAKNFLQSFGQIPPVIAAPNGEILAWEEIWLARKNRGDDVVDVVFVQGKSPDDLVAIRIALQRIPQDSIWDLENIRIALDGLEKIDFDLSLTGLDTHELDAALSLDLPERNLQDDGSDIPPVEALPVSTPGVIWQLDKHRIGCGSATDATFVSRIVNGRPADLCLTDPPYNVPVAGFISGKGRHQHREFVQGAGELTDEQFFRFLKDFLALAHTSIKPNALIMAFIDWRHICEMIAAGRLNGLALHQVITWVKSNGGMGGIWRNQSEFVCVFAGPDAAPINNVELGKNGRNRTNVWLYAGFSSFGPERDQLLGMHPTVKPVTMLADAIKDVTHRGHVVLDTFLGSGSTLMAAHETGRICFGLDLDPLYVDVAVRRWQNRTGRAAVHSSTGESFDACAQRLLASHSEPRHGNQ